LDRIILPMPNCFVIQPFDNGGKFDKRFRGVFKPAIEAAELTPYRVDQDPSVVVPIESIQEQIRDASICLADISLDNPNVWFELGFALGVGKQVVMVCSDERQGGKFPFDIQHRSIITYQSEAPVDFDDLKERLTQKLKALLEKGETLLQIARSDQVAPIEGLTVSEMTVLSALASNVMTPDDIYSAWSIQQDAEKAGLSKLAFNLGVRRLVTKNYIETREQTSDYEKESFMALRMLPAGWDWIDANESKFVTRIATREPEPKPISDDDIPF
jgi:hypothetical protein